MNKKILFLVFSLFACQQTNNLPSNKQSPDSSRDKLKKEEPPKQILTYYTYKLINKFPHDTAAFTEGLEYSEGFFYEGTGGNDVYNGVSTLRKVELETGKVLKLSNLSNTCSDCFGEGITIYDNNIIQLTWKNKTGFVYDQENFIQTREFIYLTEGWGLTHDQDNLIMSDGTKSIYYLEPENFKIIKQVDVYDPEYNTPIINLNELEYIDNKIYANVWLTDFIAIIEPNTGMILSWVDLTDLVKYLSLTVKNKLGTLNGIAYDEKNKRLFVTGKNWPNIFEIELIIQTDNSKINNWRKNLNTVLK